MPKPDSYNGLRKITTEGLTLPNGKFIGFVNQGATAQNVHVWGDLVYNGLTRSTAGVTFNVAGGALVNIEATALRPSAFDIIGYL